MSIFLSILKIIRIILGNPACDLACISAIDHISSIYLPSKERSDFQDKNEIHGRLSWLFFYPGKVFSRRKKISVWLSILGFKSPLSAEEKAARKLKNNADQEADAKTYNTGRTEYRKYGFEDEVEGMTG